MSDGVNEISHIPPSLPPKQEPIPASEPKRWERLINTLLESPSSKEINARLLDLDADETRDAVASVAQKITELAPKPEKAGEVARLSEALTALSRHHEHLQQEPVSWKEKPSGLLLRKHTSSPLSQSRAEKFERAYEELLKNPSDAALHLLKLERYIDLAEESRSPKEREKIQENFFTALKQYEQSIRNIPGRADLFKKERYSTEELRLPAQLQNEFYRVIEGFHPGEETHTDPAQLGVFFKNALSKFTALCKERPEEAQYLAKDLALAAAALGDDLEFRQFASSLDQLNHTLRNSPATASPSLSVEGLEVYEVIQIVKRMRETGEGASSALQIDPKAQVLTLAEDPTDLTPFEIRLHQVRAPLLGIAALQAERALGKNPDYLKQALEGIRRSVVTNVEDNRRQEVGEGKRKKAEDKSRWFHFSAGKAKDYVKLMWSGDSWKEKLTRMAIFGGSAAVGVGFIGAGIGLFFTPYVGPLLGPIVIGFASSVPELFVRANEGVDGFFEQENDSLEGRMRARMSNSIVDELRSRKIIPRYREVFKERLTRDEQRKADDLVRLLKDRLNQGFARTGDLQKTIEHYNDIVTTTLISTIESDDWIHAAHSEVIADWLMPELDSCIQTMHDWSSAPLSSPEEEMRKAFLKSHGLA